MGQRWVSRSRAAAEVMERADAVLDLERPLSTYCFEGPEADLSRTDIAQPAIFACSVACHAGLAEQGGQDGGGGSSSSKGKASGPLGSAGSMGFAGLSLGEFTALHLAGAFSFEAGLELVRLRGLAMQDAADANPGGMVALTGEIDEAKAVAICDAASDEGVLVPANYNSPMQVVLSGDKAACTRAAEVAEARGLRATVLGVSGAFHSPLMKPAADRLADALEAVHWSAPTSAVLSNVTGLPHGSDVVEIRSLLVRQLTEPVRWSQSMSWAAEHWPGRYVELAPGRVLSGLMRRISKSTRVTNVNEPAAEAGG